MKIFWEKNNAWLKISGYICVKIELNMGRILYRIYFWVVCVPLFLVLTLLTALFTIVGCVLGGERIFSYYPGMIWSRLTCYLALCPVTVKGAEHIEKGRSYVFVANHQGAYDNIGEAYSFIMKYAEDNGYKVAGFSRESYIDGIWNKESVDEWLTEIQLPVE